MPSRFTVLLLLPALLLHICTPAAANPAAAPGGAPLKNSYQTRHDLTAFPYFGRGDSSHSFHHPFVSHGDVPIADWRQHGSATVTTDADGRDVVRLVGGARAMQGLLHSTWHTGSDNFNGYFDINIHSHPNSAEPADGMGFFFTEKAMGIGSSMGIDSKFRGLGIIIDVFANSRKVKVPYLYAFVSDGTRKMNADVDGTDVQLTEGCQLRMDTPTRVFVQLLDNNLHVGISMAQTNEHTKWHTCFGYNNVPMPFSGGGYFGFAAETGHFHATHDLYTAAFIVGGVIRHDHGAADDEFYADDEEYQYDYHKEHHEGDHPHHDHDHRAHHDGEHHDDEVALRTSSHEELSDHLDVEVNQLFSELSDAMVSYGGSEAANNNLRQSFNDLSAITAHAFTEIDRMNAETADAERMIIEMKQRTIDLHSYSERFSAAILALHDKIKQLRVDNNRLRAEHEESQNLVDMHGHVVNTAIAALGEAAPRSFFSIVVFIMLQSLIMGGFAVVVKMGPVARGSSRMV